MYVSFSVWQEARPRPYCGKDRFFDIDNTIYKYKLWFVLKKKYRELARLSSVGCPNQLLLKTLF